MTPLLSAAAIVGDAGNWIRLGLEAIGVLIITAGAIAASSALLRRPTHFSSVRLTLARYLALALEFQLAADILETALSPGWQKIGELAAIATIRTALNYFLRREIIDEQREGASPPASPAR